MRCFIFDLDGTLCDIRHRLHHIRDPLDTPHGRLAPPHGTESKPFKKDWRAFYAAVGEDAPIGYMISLLAALATYHNIVYVSGRSEECRQATLEWMLNHDLPPGPLYMRKEKDFRPDYVIKGELLDQIMAEGYEPIMAFDDRTQVVQMWRARGIPCAQVAEGNY